MKLLESISELINEATEYIRKFSANRGFLKLYTQEHQEENVFELGLRRRIPSSVIAKSVGKHINKIWEIGDGLLRGGCEYKKCRILFIDKYPNVGQIEYIIQFYKNNRG